MGTDYSVTVVVPVFNAKRDVGNSCHHLVTGIDSSVEVLFVNDGSEDNSLGLVQELAAGYQNVGVISQEHRGAGAARNFGIAHAQGEWVYFLDADDWIKPGALEVLKTMAHDTRADVVYFDVVTADKRRARAKSKAAQKTLTDRVWRGQDYLLPAIKARVFRYSPCTQFIRRDFLLKEGITFPELHTGEDVQFSIQVALRANRVVYLDKQLFHRRLRAGSTTTSSSAIQLARDALENYRAIKMLEAEVGNHEDARIALSQLRNRLWRFALHRFDALPPEVRSSIDVRNLLVSDPVLSKNFLRETRRGMWARSLSRWVHRQDAIHINQLPTGPD